MMLPCVLIVLISVSVIDNVQCQMPEMPVPMPPIPQMPGLIESRVRRSAQAPAPPAPPSIPAPPSPPPMALETEQRIRRSAQAPAPPAPPSPPPMALETEQRYRRSATASIASDFKIASKFYGIRNKREARGGRMSTTNGYSAAALLAIVFAIPFAIRMIAHKDSGRWRHFGQAFYSAHLELFLGNGCLGIGVMMLLVLTIERYVSVCHPGFVRPVMGPPRLTVVLIPLLTFIIYLPSVFRGEIIKCVLHSDGTFVYQKRDNEEFLETIFYSVYKVILEIFFKLVPTVLIAGLNLRIIIVYRRSCAKRRQMTIARNSLKDDDPRKFAEERRLILLLGSTSILFLVCVSPMAILHMTLSHENLTSYSFQVFRALANLMELTNYSTTFYIYCLFSEDFRNTLFRTLKWPWIGNPICNQRKDEFQMQTRPIIKAKKLPNKNNHIHHTTTSGLCTLGRSSSI